MLYLLNAASRALISFFNYTMNLPGFSNNGYVKDMNRVFAPLGEPPSIAMEKGHPVSFTIFIVPSSQRELSRDDVTEVVLMSEVKSGKALEDLVKFLIYLAVLGLLAALVIYFMAVAPGQQVVAPMNVVN